MGSADHISETSGKNRHLPIIIACLGGIALIAGIVVFILTLTKTNPVVGKYSLYSIITNGKDNPQKATLLKVMGVKSELVFHRNGTGKIIIPDISMPSQEEIEENLRRKEESSDSDHAEDMSADDASQNTDGVPMITYDFTWKDGEMLATIGNRKMRSSYSFDGENTIVVDGFFEINQEESGATENQDIQYKFRRDK